MILKVITDDNECRQFMNSVPYPEYWPETLPAITPVSFVLGVYNPELVGCFPFNIKNGELFIHACFLKEWRGKFAVGAAKNAFKWIWSNTSFKKIVSEITEKHASRFAISSGMSKKQNRYEVVKWATL